MLICKIAVQRYSFLLTLPNIFCNFARKLTIKMRKYIKYIGFLLTFTGVLLQAVCFFLPDGNHNTLLLTAFFCVMAGVVMYIYNYKKDSGY